MDHTFYLIYYVACSILGIITFKGIHSPILKWITVALTFLFALNVIDLILQLHLGFIAVICFVLASIFFVRAIAKHAFLSRGEKTLFIIYTIMLIFKFIFAVLHLNGADEMSVICFVILLITIGRLLYSKLKKKSLKGKTDIIEVGGLLTCFWLPTFVRIFI